MTEKDLEFFKEWFSGYVKTFYTGSREDFGNISLKELHTFRVCDNMRLLIDDPEIKGTAGGGETGRFDMMAETVALFHDVGRFQQYAEYKTFRDSVSVNHALLGASILEDKGILSILSERERKLILKAVRLHNAFNIPDIEDSEALLLSKLIRDADKLDIWRIFNEYYESPTDEKASAAGLGLPDTSEYSEEVLVCIFERRVAALSMLKTLNDFKLLQLSWIYDLNLRTSLKLLLERGYIGRIVRTLPQTEEIRRVPAFLMEYIEKRLREAFSHERAPKP